ncbi:MAG: peptidoglycan DD-metalloendopeptidase family protein [Clostridium sp.]|nr:peptidoglycan DD-metalloendopeptidase family protein [Clostridium sp.]
MKKRMRTLRAGIAVLLTCVISTQVYATSLDDAQQDKKDAEDNKSQAEEILAGLESKKSDIQTYIYDLDTQMADIQVRINDLNNQKSDLETQITQKQADLETAKAQEQNQYAEMCSRIQYMYENENTDYAAVLLSAESMSDLLNEPEYVSAMAGYDYTMLEQLIATREQIANDELILEQNLAAVEGLTQQVQEEEDTVSALLDEKNKEMAEYDDLIKDQQEKVEQYDAEIQAASDRIAAIEAEAARKAQEAQQNQTTVSTDTGSNYVPYTGGALLWPCPSSTRINSGFGTREASGVVTANHYGIDIGCPDGTPIVAAASGVVVLARRSATAGNWIIISHGNGLYTIYMHASALYVSEGQYVNAGDTIMLSGATGATQGRHLHYEVRVGGYSSSRYSVNPMNYY